MMSSPVRRTRKRQTAVRLQRPPADSGSASAPPPQFRQNPAPTPAQSPRNLATIHQRIAASTGAEVVSVLKRLFARIQPTFQAIQRASGAAARALLGEVDWQAPPWAKWTAARIRQGAQATVARARQHPARPQ
jgi:hypothetical protein